jgi:acetoacetate decarboxylase
MVNVNDKDFRYYSMPIHNPLYKQRRISHRGDIVRIPYTVKNPEVLAAIIPEPLVYNDDKIIIDVNMIKDTVSGFPDKFKVWIEFGMKMLVTYKGEPKTYMVELYANNMDILFIDREFFGMPRLPGNITSDINGSDISVTLSDYQSNRDMINISFKSSGEKSKPQDPPPGGQVRKHPPLIWMKYIPSASLDYVPDVKKLIEINYGSPPAVRKQMEGVGNVELLESAPDYLKEAGIAKINESVYSDMEFDVMGGNVLHNYI